MDGQRRVSEQVRSNRHFRPDCPAKYRVMARALAICFVMAAIARGAVVGGHLDYPGSPWLKMPGKVAGLFGLAAFDIELTGLQHHDPAEVLAHISVKPGGPLLGFDAKKARDKLEQLDWVDTASVVRRFPNQLHITVAEREPFVVWQHEDKFVVVDKQGEPMSGVAPTTRNLLLHVVGPNANTDAPSLVNLVEATPELLRELVAAVRVGGRRWDLHMQGGMILAMPEDCAESDFRLAETIYFMSKREKLSVQRIDLRFRGELAYRAAIFTTINAADPTTTSSIQ